jgi:hypothetical protein
MKVVKCKLEMVVDGCSDSLYAGRPIALMGSSPESGISSIIKTGESGKV